MFEDFFEKERFEQNCEKLNKNIYFRIGSRTPKTWALITTEIIFLVKKMRFLSSQTFRHMIALLIIQARGRNPGQGPRDPAVPVPKIWNGDRDS